MLWINCWKICRSAQGWERPSNSMATRSWSFHLFESRRGNINCLHPSKSIFTIKIKLHSIPQNRENNNNNVPHQMSKSISDSRNSAWEVLWSDIRIQILKKSEVVKALKPAVTSEEIMIMKIYSLWFGSTLHWNYFNKESSMDHKRKNFWI